MKSKKCKSPIKNQYQWHSNYQDTFGLTTNSGVRVYSHAISSDYINLWEVPNLYLKKFVGEMFTDTLHLTITATDEGQQSGFVVMGRDYCRQFPDDGWAAIEFEEPQHISEVRFLPRNDDNFIREGEQYELYYWDGRRFASIARMEGNREGVLYVDNVPTNVLLLLRNHTKGKEERIFTYENGE